MTAVAKVILGDILGVGYSVDPRVQGTITLSSGRPVPKSRLLFVLESALRTSNAVLVHDAGGFGLSRSTTPSAMARWTAHRSSNQEPGYGLHRRSGAACFRADHHETARWLRDPPGAIRSDPSNNLILIVGNGVERSTAVDTVLSFDQDWLRGQSVGIFPVKNTRPEPIVAELEKILEFRRGRAQPEYGQVSADRPLQRDFGRSAQARAVAGRGDLDRAA